MNYYILADGKPECVGCDEIGKMKFKRWLKDQNAQVICVAETHLIYPLNGNVVTAITTRYTGCDDGMSAKPLLWETRITYDPKNTWRHASKEEAVKMHEQYVCERMEYFRKHVFTVIRRDIRLTIEEAL